MGEFTLLQKHSTGMKQSLLQTLRRDRRAFRRALIHRYVAPVLCKPVGVSEKPALIIAPHQDDETFGCGGLIALKRRIGVPVTVVFVTDGGACYGDNIPDMARRKLVVLREAEATAALGVLGVSHDNILFLRFPDGALSSLDAEQQARLNTLLTLHLEDSPAREVYVPHRRDSHPDHEATYRIVGDILSATENTGKQTPELYEYPVWLFWSRNRLFDNLGLRDLANGQRIIVAGVLGDKAAAIQQYPSQLASLPPGFAEQFLLGNEFFFRSNPKPR